MCTITHRITAPFSPLDMHPTLRISHFHKYHNGRLLHSLLILPSSPQGQTRRLLPNVSLKTPYAMITSSHTHRRRIS
jgi:hypothetical protein